MSKKLTTEEFIQRAKAVHGDKYDYSKVEYVNSNTKACIICPEHGEFYQTPNKHFYGHGCHFCGGTSRKSVEEFIIKAKSVHNNKYDYSKVNYVNNNTKVCIICPIHGEFYQTPANHINKEQDCPICGMNSRASKMRFTTEEFIQRAKAVHGDKYDYSKVDYINSYTKVCIVCPVHGEFWILPDEHLHGTGCKKCYHDSRKLTLEEFISKAKLVHGDKYDYSKVNYINSYTKVCIVCPVHGEFYQTPNFHLRGSGCPCCKTSKGEKKIEDFLKQHNIKFIHDKPCLACLGKLRPDFYLPDYNLVIEYDGEQHFKAKKAFGGDKKLEKQKELDNLKNKLCEENNIDILRIPYTKFKQLENILLDKINIRGTIIMENLSEEIQLNEYTEFNDSTCQILTEEENGKKLYKIRGCFSKAGVKNLNGRVYPREVMKKAVEDAQPLIKAGKFIAECEHPSSAKINLDRIAAKVNSLQMMDDDTVIGEMVVLDTEAGKTIKTLIDSGIRFGVSTRGMGSVKAAKMDLGEGIMEDVLEVQPGFKLVAVDCVFSPSANEFGSPDFVVEGVDFSKTKRKTISQIFKEMF